MWGSEENFSEWLPTPVLQGWDLDHQPAVASASPAEAFFFLPAKGSFLLSKQLCVGDVASGRAPAGYIRGHGFGHHALAEKLNTL